MPPPVNLASLTIANGQTVSNTLDFAEGLNQYITEMVIYGPDTLPETVTVEVAPLGSTAYKPLQNMNLATPADYVITVGDAVQFPVAFGRLRLVAGGPVGDERAFLVSGQENR